VPVVDDDHGVVGGVPELIELFGEPPGPALVADGAKRRGVGTALGEEVTAEAEHVGPFAQVQLRVLGQAAEVPCGLDEPPVVGGEVHSLEVGEGADGPVGVAVGFAGALGGVLGDVAGQPAAGDLAVLVGDGVVGGRGDLAQVELSAQRRIRVVPSGRVTSRLVAVAASWTASRRASAVSPAGGGSAGPSGPSRRIAAWKWTSPRRYGSPHLIAPPGGTRGPRPPGSNFLYLVKAPRPRRREEEQEPRR
jgi:hypothetical protein